MHIQEGPNTTLTTCTKMTEEVDRRHGVNGNSSSKSASEDASALSPALNATGGRLKFFKDGKFILELVRGCSREGERAGWVSVPRKTFWPPAAAPAAPGTPGTPPAPPPSAPSASLSVSDDNSSIQSSPWQRDHCWKQAAPRRNLSKELAMYYCRPATLHTATIAAGSARKRRRPHDAALLDADALPNGLRRAPSTPTPTPNGVCDTKRNGDADPPPPDGACRGEDAVDGASDSRAKPTSSDDRWTNYDREKYYHMKLKKPYQYHKLRVYKKTRPALRRKELARTVERLRERAAALPVPPAPPVPAPVNAKLASCRQEHAMVSPRKRILRDLERVSLEDQNMKRRAKTVPALSTASYPPSPGPSHAAKLAATELAPAPAPPAARTAAHNGAAAAARRDAAPVTKNVSSYSIHSLLSMPDERRSPEAKRSPHSYPPSVKTESPGSARSPDLSPSPDSYRYRYAALALGSPGPDPPTPPPDLARYRYPPVAVAAPPYARQWGATPPPPPAPAQYRGAPAGGGGARDEWRELAYYPYAYAAPLYRAPPPLWMHYAAPPGPWAPLAHPLLTDHIPKDEPSSDLPLNLSKH